MAPNQRIWVAELEGRIIAVALAKFFSPETSFEFYALYGEATLAKLRSFRVGSFSSMGVHEDFQRHGIGMQLSLKREEWLKSLGADLIVGISWVSGLPNSSDRNFEKMGFISQGTVKSLFETSMPDLLCPVCKVPPCLCAGTLYFKEV